jgi:hypothetical protein
VQAAYLPAIPLALSLVDRVSGGNAAIPVVRATPIALPPRSQLLSLLSRACQRPIETLTGTDTPALVGRRTLPDVVGMGLQRLKTKGTKGASGHLCENRRCSRTCRHMLAGPVVNSNRHM